MFIVLGNTWALMLGMMLLMVGNGLQGTLIGVRGELEGFSTIELSVVMSAYFVGFLGASRLVPELIRRVGHVRVFAALAKGASLRIGLSGMALPLAEMSGMDKMCAGKFRASAPSSGGVRSPERDSLRR